MAAWVRFATGLVVKYNDVNHVEEMSSGVFVLSNSKHPREFIAKIPPGADCVIEGMPPCAVTYPQSDLNYDSLQRLKQIQAETLREVRVMMNNTLRALSEPAKRKATKRSKRKATKTTKATKGGTKRAARS